MGCGASTALPREGAATPALVAATKVQVHRPVRITLAYFVESISLGLSQTGRLSAAALVVKTYAESKSVHVNAVQESDLLLPPSHAGHGGQGP